MNNDNGLRVTKSPPGCQVPGGPPLIYIEGYESPDFAESISDDGEILNRERKARRFFVRCRDGILVAQERGYTVRTFVLTESDYAIGMGLDYGRAVNKFNTKLRYDYGRDIGLLWVEHLQGEKVRRNRHIVEWGVLKLDLDDLNDYWLKVYGSLITWRKKEHGGMVVSSAEKWANYLAEYFSGEGFVRARFSNNWVFPGWFEYGKWSREVYGAYPSIAELALLAGLSPVGRLSVPHYREWYESNQDKLKSLLADRILGKSADEVRWSSEYKRRRHRVRKLRLGDAW
jgi:hypothetical protein